MLTYIEKIEIQAYRSCKNCTFSPQKNLSALIGPNGSGKTSILRSILLLKALVHEDLIRSRLVEDDNTLESSMLKITLSHDGKKIIHTSNMQIANESRADDEVIVGSKQKWYMKDVTGNKKLIKMPISIFSSAMGRYVLEDNQGRFLPRRFSVNTDLEQLRNKRVTDVIQAVSKFYNGISYYSASQFTNPSLCPVSIEVDDDNRARTRERDGHKKWFL